MNYTGFGSDPNYIYSFRSPQPIGVEALARQDRLSPLRNSLAYRQAGMEGKQRMEQAVGMGLPFNTDLNKVQKVGIDPFGFGPIYAAPRPQPWGTWGPLSAGDVSGTGPFRNSVWREEQRQAAAIQKAATARNQNQKSEPVTQTAPQPARTPQPVGYMQSQYGTGFSRTPMGFTGEPASFTSGGQYFGMAPRPTATSTPIPFPELNTRNYFSSTMGGIRFPFSNY